MGLCWKQHPLFARLSGFFYVASYTCVLCSAFGLFGIFSQSLFKAVNSSDFFVWLYKTTTGFGGHCISRLFYLIFCLVYSLSTDLLFVPVFLRHCEIYLPSLFLVAVAPVVASVVVPVAAPVFAPVVFASFFVFQIHLFRKQNFPQMFQNPGVLFPLIDMPNILYVTTKVHVYCYLVRVNL